MNGPSQEMTLDELMEHLPRSTGAKCPTHRAAVELAQLRTQLGDLAEKLGRTEARADLNEKDAIKSHQAGREWRSERRKIRSKNIRLREALKEMAFLAETGGTSDLCPFWVRDIGDCNKCGACSRSSRFEKANAVLDQCAPEKESEEWIAVNQIVPLAEVERRYVLKVLEHHKGNRKRTAEVLGIGTNTLWRKLKAWGVPAARGEESEL